MEAFSAGVKVEKEKLCVRVKGLLLAWRERKKEKKKYLRTKRGKVQTKTVFEQFMQNLDERSQKHADYQLFMI